jgi:anti-sigma factor ChrR (cupin superfamily)
MNEETDTPDEQAMLYALGSLNETERQQFENCLQCPHSTASAKVASYTHLVGTISASWQPEKAPRAELKERIMAAIDTPVLATPKESALPAGISFLMQSESRWHTTPYPGVQLRELSNASAEMAIFMLQLAPGTNFPNHDHHGSEDMYLLSGDLDINGTRMGPGDFMHSAPSSQHHGMHSAGGCQAIVVTSKKNYSSGIMHAYSKMDRVKTTVRRWLGKGEPVSR